VSTCVTAVVLDSRRIYPVFDLRRLSGPGGWRFGYAFALDAVEIQVTPTPDLTRGEMRVILNAKLREPKAIQGINIPTNSVVSAVETAPTLTGEVRPRVAIGSPLKATEPLSVSYR
jgi:hypothetical protein